MTIMQSMFEHPRGLPGWVGGLIMAQFTRARNEWMLSLMDIRPTDHILEVGFGPGVMINMLAKQAYDGKVVGVDISSLMLAQARKRNRYLIRAGRVRLEQGSAMELPFVDDSFDKAVSSNSVQLWPDSFKGLMEMRRVLRHDGRIAAAIQPVWAESDAEVKQIESWLVDLFQKAGFRNIELKRKSMKPVDSLCVIGFK